MESGALVVMENADVRRCLKYVIRQQEGVRVDVRMDWLGQDVIEVILGC